MDKSNRKLKILYEWIKANTSAMWQHRLHISSPGAHWSAPALLLGGVQATAGIKLTEREEQDRQQASDRPVLMMVILITIIIIRRRIRRRKKIKIIIITKNNKK